MYKKRQKHALLMRRPNNRLVGLHSTTNRSYTSIFLFFFFFIPLAHLCHLGSCSYSEPVSKTLDYTMKQMRAVAGPTQRALGVALACRLW